MYRNLGLDLPGCAQLLHVTERTLHNWQSGKHDIPFAAYKLLRLLNRMELPGESWAGWCFHGGKLWNLMAARSSVRMAHCGHCFSVCARPLVQRNK
ncbi:hypothetical protein [Acidovorax sp. SUPP2539]|uniref:helix-turn-helix domain-containing protein n=1 Tax=Acidovorax sp. SUPP2539 TaxID=2920878 RepID=UPI0023DE334E|nr:hypothetical protein [Acidovorax sp. SUPP2539]GKS91582.1 hypothetical protein AVTE2539_19475 [Acidovorax sp. SUPP2539]